MKERFVSVMAIILSVALIFAIPCAAAANISDFSDIPDGWARNAVIAAIENGLLEGHEGKIRPNDNITRAELAVILVRAFGASQKADISGFTDVPSGSWFHDPMAIAVKMGIYIGEGDKLRPDDPATREEVFTVIARTLMLSPEVGSVLDRFSDKGSVADWALGYTAALVRAGYVNGYDDGTLRPKNNITRAEVAQILHNSVQYYIDTPGVYTQIFTGNVVVRVPGVIFVNCTISGNLYIGDGVGSGKVKLQGTAVGGTTIKRLSSSVVEVIPSVITVPPGPIIPTPEKKQYIRINYNNEKIINIAYENDDKVLDKLDSLLQNSEFEAPLLSYIDRVNDAVDEIKTEHITLSTPEGWSFFKDILDVKASPDFDVFSGYIDGTLTLAEVRDFVQNYKKVFAKEISETQRADLIQGVASAGAKIEANSNIDVTLATSAGNYSGIEDVLVFAAGNILYYDLTCQTLFTLIGNSATLTASRGGTTITITVSRVEF